MKIKNQEENQELNQEEEQELNLEGRVKIEGVATIEDLMDVLYVTRQTLVKYIKENRIPAYNVGKGKYLIATEELIEKIKENSDSLKKQSDI